MAASGTIFRCGVTVEVGGKAIHKARGVKDLGLQIVDKGKGAREVHVLGFKREIAFSASTVAQIVEGRIAEGTLVVVTKDRIQVRLANAHPAQLETLLQCLRPTAGGAAPPSSAKPVVAGQRPAPGAEAPQAKRPRAAAGPPGATPAKAPADAAERTPTARSDEVAGVAPVGLATMSEVLLKEVFSFARLSAVELMAWSETCRALSAYVIERRQPALRLSTTMSVAADRVIEAVGRRGGLRVLDLGGYDALSCGAAGRMAKALLDGGIRLRALSLHGCKALSEVAIRRVLASCPDLVSLSLLEIPRLTDQVLTGAPLPGLRVLAAGYLGRSGIASPSASAPEVAGTVSTASGVVRLAPATKAQYQGFAKFTERIATISEGDARGVARPLTHLVLPNCSTVQAFPAVTASLMHLDLRGAAVQVRDGAVAGWRPLAACSKLETLCLAGCSELSAAALVACLASVPEGARLKVLDLSDTRAEGGVFRAVRTLSCTSELTHLRLAYLPVTDTYLLGLLRSRPSLEVLDVCGCSRIEDGFVGLRPVDGEALTPNLRFLNVGGTRLGNQIEAVRTAARQHAPRAQVVANSQCALDLFGGYRSLPSCVTCNFGASPRKETVLPGHAG